MNTVFGDSTGIRAGMLLGDGALYWLVLIFLINNSSKKPMCASACARGSVRWCMFVYVCECVCVRARL